MHLTRTSLTLLILMVLTTIIFWWLVPRTAERLASLIFFVLVSGYALYSHRHDVIAASAAFFTAVDINYYLFDWLSPIWLGLIILSTVLLIIWIILFGQAELIVAIGSILVSLELMLTSQYINLEPKVQALFIILPFIVASQSVYFRLHPPLTRP